MTNKFEINYLPIAEQDLTEIIDYISIDNPEAAISVLNIIDQAIDRLSDFPHSGSIPNDIRLRSLNYRIIVVGNYLVFYVVMNDEVEIRRILHGRRKYDFLP